MRDVSKQRPLAGPPQGPPNHSAWSVEAPSSAGFFLQFFLLGFRRGPFKFLRDFEGVPDETSTFLEGILQGVRCVILRQDVLFRSWVNASHG